MNEAWGGAGFLAVAAASMVLFAAGVVTTRRILTKAETHADQQATAHADGPVYAQALEKLYREMLIPAGEKSHLGHAPLYDRMVEAGVQPDLARPPKTSSRDLLAGAAMIIPALLCGVLPVGFAAAREIVLAKMTTVADRAVVYSLAGVKKYELAQAASEAASLGGKRFRTGVRSAGARLGTRRSCSMGRGGARAGA